MLGTPPEKEEKMGVLPKALAICPFRAQVSPEGTKYHQVGELSKDIIP